jgi:hypothetical protein
MPRHHDDAPAPSHPDTSLDRRRFLVRLGAAALAAPLTLSFAHAQSHDGHGEGGMDGMAMQGEAIGPDLLAASEIPWEEGTCDFCGMTLRTPPDGRLPEGFRERTYGQIRLAEETRVDGRDALHFESLACLHNRAWVEGLRDGHGATFHVADHAAPPEAAADLRLGREAAYLWAQGLRVSMNARLAAFADADAAAAALRGLEQPGRHRLLDAALLADLAPLPEMNLVPLLAQHSGLLE